MEDTEEYRAIEAMKEHTPGSRRWACSYAECDREKTLFPFVSRFDRFPLEILGDY